MSVVPKGEYRSEAYWKKHSDGVKRERDIRIYSHLNKHPIQVAIKEYAETDKHALQKMNLSALRTFILSTGIDPELAASKYGF
jgi:hypothetical protein